MKESWKLDPVFRQEFLDACKEAATNDEAFANFRKNDRIATVIENTPQWWADKAQELMGMTPTMVRYQYLVYLIKKLLKLDLMTLFLCEIGAGYGGFVEVVSRHAKLGTPTIIFDLPEAIQLQKRFLEGKFSPYGLWFNSEIDKERSDLGDYKSELCVSWCAWSELTREKKQEYYDYVISKSMYIFIGSNYNVEEDREILSQGFDVQTYSDELVTGVLYGKKK